jgi:lysophospholipase L1-like esterase
MYAATGDRKYIDYLDKEWANTYTALWDSEEHLYARDETFKPSRGPNGKKIFWSRGEGWVMGGLARTLEYLPKDDPRRAFYEQNLRDLAASLTKLLDPQTHLFHASLLDPEHFPLDETSGSALYLYGLAWGVNEGVLDAKTYKPVIGEVWASLLKHHVYADGRFGGIQQTGAEPAFYPPSASFTYGVGGYLLAAAELKRMSLGHHAPPRLAQQLPPQSAQLPAKQPVVTDPTTHARIDLPTPADPQLQNLILVGDSTVRNGKGDGANNQMGWGDELAPYFDLSKINVVNRAIGGRSSRTYITEGHWERTLPFIRTGDVVLIQFGHNDSGPLDDTSRGRGSIGGIGDETKEIENPILKRHETVHTFGWYLTQYVRDVKARGGIPVLCSMIPRKIWKDGKVERTTDTYRGWTRAVAEQEHVPFLDLNEIIAEKYEALGEAAVEPLFGDPHTHTTAAGAILNAKAVVAGLKGLSNDPVAKDFSAAGEAIPAFHP